MERCYVLMLDVRRTNEFRDVMGTTWLDESYSLHGGLGGSMAQLLVTCPECGVRGELAHSGQEFNNPAGKCKHVLPPARCPSLRIPLLGARRVLEHLEWDAFLAADGEIRIPADFVQTPTGPDPDEVVPDPIS